MGLEAKIEEMEKRLESKNEEMEKRLKPLSEEMEEDKGRVGEKGGWI